MKLICSPSGIVDMDHPAQGVIDLAGAGFTNTVLDLSLLANSRDIYNRRLGKVKENQLRVINDITSMSDCVRGFSEKCRQQNITLAIAYAPYLERRTTGSDDNVLIEALVKESIRVAGKLGCTSIVVRPLFAGIEADRLWDENKRYYTELAAVAREVGIKILLENQCRYINGHMVRGICSDGVEAAQWVDELNHITGSDTFGFCVNVGVCNLCGQNMYDFIVALGARIDVVIVSDGDGHRENAILPFTSVNEGCLCTDWLKLIRGLREISYDGSLILDMKDAAAATPPLLRPAFMVYAKQVIDYLTWQIDIEKNLRRYESRVLFGAGNMCRNYMKCYGDTYPPLYTCDNNSKLWGTEFCGLTIQNPEELKNLPKETAIFICNIFYRDIEKQLRDMGITNPIEYFNDEYLQTFHFDRIDANTRQTDRG